MHASHTLIALALACSSANAAPTYSTASTEAVLPESVGCVKGVLAVENGTVVLKQTPSSLDNEQRLHEKRAIPSADSASHPEFLPGDGAGESDTLNLDSPPDTSPTGPLAGYGPRPKALVKKGWDKPGDYDWTPRIRLKSWFWGSTEWSPWRAKAARVRNLTDFVSYPGKLATERFHQYSQKWHPAPVYGYSVPFQRPQYYDELTHHQPGDGSSSGGQKLRQKRQYMWKETVPQPPDWDVEHRKLILPKPGVVPTKAPTPAGYRRSLNHPADVPSADDAREADFALAKRAPSPRHRAPKKSKADAQRNWVDSFGRWGTEATYEHYHDYAGRLDMHVPWPIAPGMNGPCYIHGTWVNETVCICDVYVRPFFIFSQAHDLACFSNVSLEVTDPDAPNVPEMLGIRWHGSWIRKSTRHVHVSPYITGCIAEGTGCYGIEITHNS